MALLSLPVIGQQIDTTAAKPSEAGKKLVVGTKEAPPFAFKDEAGNWTGITIEMWRGMAHEMGVDFEIKEYDLAGLLDAVGNGEVDVAASALTVTAERAETMGFSPTYYGSGLGIATTYEKPDIWTTLARRLFTWTFLKALLALVAVLFITGVLIWLFERSHNAEQFGGKTHHGLGNGFWWSAVTMTTVGYGDIAPRSVGGRVIGLIWMFTSVIIISGFTGAIATALTVGQLEPTVRGPQDLPNVTVGALNESSAEDYLESKGIHPTTFKSVNDGLDAVKQGKIQAFVNDHPILVYRAAKSFPGNIDVLAHSFDPGYLALAYPLNSSHGRDIDLALLEFIQSPGWEAILQKYVGQNR